MRPAPEAKVGPTGPTGPSGPAGEDNISVGPTGATGPVNTGPGGFDLGNASSSYTQSYDLGNAT